MHHTKSPNAFEVETLELMSRWRRVRIDDVDVYVPRNAPIKVPSRTVALGQVDSGDDLTAATLEDKRAGDSSGE